MFSVKLCAKNEASSVSQPYKYFRKYIEVRAVVVIGVIAVVVVVGV